MNNSFRKKIKKIIPRSLLIQRLDPLASNSVLLTFDDGPHPEVTPQVLKRLEAYGARAVFFILGRHIERAPHLLKTIQEQGHLIGNHTYIHSVETEPWFLAYYRDILHCQRMIAQYTGESPRLFRPTRGKISFTSLLAPRLVGLRTVTWSLDLKDWRCQSNEEAQRCGEDYVKNSMPRDIILLHDDNPNVLTILDMLLPSLKSRNIDVYDGLNFLTKGLGGIK